MLEANMATSRSSPSGTRDHPRRGDAPAAPPRTPADAAPPARIHVVAWPDPVIDRLGYDPRSHYVERFWLGVLGPTSTWLLRRLVAGLDQSPGGFDLDLDDTARALGLGGKAGRHSPFRRAVARCITFGMARDQGNDELAVRRHLPPLPRRHLLRLPPALQAEHAQWIDAQRRASPLEFLRQRARRLALGLLELDADTHAAELQLLRWRVHPAIAHEAVLWARTRRVGASATPALHADADAALTDPGAPVAVATSAVRLAGATTQERDNPAAGPRRAREGRLVGAP